MPLYTFHCAGCGDIERVCKYEEKASQACENPECDRVGDVMVPHGVEGSQAVRMDGKHRFKAIMRDGSEREPAHHGKPRRSDS